MKTIVRPRAECESLAARQLRALLEEKPDAVLALEAGPCTAGLYEELARLCAAGELSLRRARVFSVAEPEDCPTELSCRRQLERALLGKTDLDPKNCRFLDADTAEGYEAAVAAAGGLDLAVLGLGDKGRLGFNEPATPYASRTHRQKLTDATRRELAPLFGGEEQTPGYGWTMGIKTLAEARQILVLAFGEALARPAFQMLYARDDSIVPAAFLQLPRDVTVYLDPPAAEKI